MTYDSRPETYAHSQRVGELMIHMIRDALDRSTCHDRSKTEDPELETFDRVTPQLKELTYGTPEYKAALQDMGPALQHHYKHNSHHPEHHVHGVNGMTLIDLIEMLADWKAATERHTDGDLSRSLKINQERFQLSDQLADILANTARTYSWL